MGRTCPTTIHLQIHPISTRRQHVSAGLHATDTLWHPFFKYLDNHPSRQSGLCPSQERSQSSTQGYKWTYRSFAGLMVFIVQDQKRIKNAYYTEKFQTKSKLRVFKMQFIPTNLMMRSQRIITTLFRISVSGDISNSRAKAGTHFFANSSLCRHSLPIYE